MALSIISIVISALACTVSALALIRNSKADTKKDAGQMTEIIVKLNVIDENVKEVKSDMKDNRADVDKVKERLIIVEESTKSAHKRIDGLVYEIEKGNLNET